MPNLQGVRRRIKAVRNMRQITKSYKLVSASKLRRAQERVTAARPYARKMQDVLQDLTSNVGDFSSPQLETRSGNRTLIVLITSDKGLCGAFNANLIRTVQQFVRERSDEQIEMVAVGRKGRDFFRRRLNVRKEYVNLTAKTVTYADAAQVARDLMEIFEGGAEGGEAGKELLNRPDRVYLIYAEFRSAISQVVKIEQLLPIGQIEKTTKDVASPTADYIYEQPAADIFNLLLPRYVETQVFQALLESVASEHGARMAAMDSASRNATQVIGNLTLSMNRIRQAAITNEIIEVVSGAAAL